MPSRGRERLVPWLGFALMVGASAWVAAASGDEPPAAVHAGARAYGAALSEGRLDDAVRFHVQPDAEILAVERDRVRQLRGALWVVRAVEPLGDGAWVSILTWYLGGRGAEERLVWSRADDGAFRIVGWQDPGRRLGRGAGWPAAAFQ